MADTPKQIDEAGALPTLAGFSLTGMPGHLIRRCQQRAVDLFVEEVGEDGPTPRQFAILLNVYRNEGINQTDLVRLSGIDRSTLTEILRRMIGRGLIRRERTRRDLRANALFITRDGAELLRGALPAVVRAQQRILEPIAPEHRAPLLKALESLAGLPDGVRSAVDGDQRRAIGGA